MKVFIISAGYPSKTDSQFVFVERLINEFANQGIKCTVICPQSITSFLFKFIKPYPYKTYTKTNSGEIIKIIRPFYISFSNSNLKIANFISTTTYSLAIKWFVNMQDNLPSLFYAHFWTSGLRVFDISSKHNIPLFIASGESTIPSLNYFSSNKMKRFSNYLSHVICVSEKNKQESISNGLVLANNGKKMSKRLKNYPNPIEVIDRYGADSLRLYLLCSPIVKAETLSFSEDGVRDISKSVLIPFENTRDLEEIPDDIKSQLEIKPVRWIDEVLEIALQDSIKGFSVEKNNK